MPKAKFKIDRNTNENKVDWEARCHELETDIKLLKLQIKQLELDKERFQEILQREKYNLKPKERQITEAQIEEIKELRKQGLSYSSISKATKWSKATICRVMNGVYDI